MLKPRRPFGAPALRTQRLRLAGSRRHSRSAPHALRRTAFGGALDRWFGTSQDRAEPARRNLDREDSARPSSICSAAISARRRPTGRRSGVKLVSACRLETPRRLAKQPVEERRCQCSTRFVGRIAIKRGDDSPASAAIEPRPPAISFSPLLIRVDKPSSRNRTRSRKARQAAQTRPEPVGRFLLRLIPGNSRNKRAPALRRGRLQLLRVGFCLLFLAALLERRAENIAERRAGVGRTVLFDGFFFFRHFASLD